MSSTEEADVSAENLPLPDYDHLPMGSLQHRIRSLTRDELAQVLDYERGHNDRPQVVELLNRRMAELEAGAEPAPGAQDEEDPVELGRSSGGSPVGPGGSPEPIHPPRHGVQGPGKPKGNRAR